MAGNEAFARANRAKNDEFYTQLVDVEAELRHYRDQFRGKVILCNCDDPYESSFFKYFAMNFNHLGLKKLITTSYAGSPITGERLSVFDVEGMPAGTAKNPAYRVEITEVPDVNNDGAIDLSDVEYLLKHGGNILTLLSGDGDFRSAECLALLDEADIVVTNPPFSLFREYVAQLIERDKQFLIIGSKNAITYKEIFPLIMKNRLWLGHGFNDGNAFFRVPGSYRNNFVAGVFNEKTGLVKFRNVGWFTNMDTTKRHEPLTPYKRYTPEEYPTYTNYPAIEVAKVAEIPMDYDGEMGVPITFLDKYNPKQFEILGSSRSLAEPMSNYAERGTYMQGGPRFYVPEGDGRHRRLYDRVVIRRIGVAQ